MLRSFLMILLLALLAACHASRNAARFSDRSDIYFVFPNAVTGLFKNNLSDSSYFCLYSDSCCYELFIDNGSNPYARRTNRKVFIDGKSYPLIFDYDMYLGTTTSGNELLRQFDAGEYIETEKSIAIHEGFYVRFGKYNGKVIASGHGILK